MKSVAKRRASAVSSTPRCLPKGKWSAPDVDGFALALRNTGRIEQLEAGQEALQSQLTRFMENVSSELGKTVVFWEWCSIGEGSVKTPPSWERADARWYPTLCEDATHVLLDTGAILHADRLGRMEDLLRDLADDFEEIPRRIVQAALLEEEFAALEEALDDDDGEHFAWCVSLLRDALEYNYAEDFTRRHLELIREGVSVLCAKGTDCTKADYQALHASFVDAGLQLIPVTPKAIEKYGE